MCESIRVPLCFILIVAIIVSGCLDIFSSCHSVFLKGMQQLFGVARGLSDCSFGCEARGGHNQPHSPFQILKNPKKQRTSFAYKNQKLSASKYGVSGLHVVGIHSLHLGARIAGRCASVKGAPPGMPSLRRGCVGERPFGRSVTQANSEGLALLHIALTGAYS